MIKKLVVLWALAAIIFLVVSCETPGVLREQERTKQAMQERMAEVEVAAQQRMAVQAEAAAQAEAARAAADVRIFQEQVYLQSLVENNAQEIRRMQENQAGFEKRMIMLLAITSSGDQETLSRLRHDLEDQLSPNTESQLVRRLLIWLSAIFAALVFVFIMLAWKILRQRLPGLLD